MMKRIFVSVLAVFLVATPVEAWTSAYGGFNARGKSFGVMRGAARYDRLVCRSVADPSDMFGTPTPGKAGRTVTITCPDAHWSVLACRENGRCSTLVVGKWRRR